MGIPDHITWLLRSLYAGQVASFRTGHGTTDCFKIEKGVHEDCMLSSCLFNYMQSTSCEMLGWMKHRLESSLTGEISITSHIQMTPTKYQRVKNWRASWWTWKRRVKKVVQNSASQKWNHGIWSHHFMANKWGRSGNSNRFYFLGLQKHCRWWLQPWN